MGYVKTLVLAVTLLGACGSDGIPTDPDAGDLDASTADAEAPDAGGDAGPPPDAELSPNDCRVLCGPVGYHCSAEGEWLCNVAAQDIPCEYPDACPQ